MISLWKHSSRVQRGLWRGKALQIKGQLRQVFLQMKKKSPKPTKKEKTQHKKYQNLVISPELFSINNSIINVTKHWQSSLKTAKVLVCSEWSYESWSLSGDSSIFQELVTKIVSAMKPDCFYRIIFTATLFRITPLWHPELLQCSIQNSSLNS